MITAIVLTKDEERNIGECLRSLRWCDEVIVIDDNSSDRTGEIVDELGFKVYRRSLDHDFASQRNFGLQKARGDWILFVDADERVSLSLSYEILHLINETLDGCVGYAIPRNDTMWGRELRHGETGPTKLLRLAKKDAGEWKGKVHEKWMIRGKTGVLKHALLHYPHQTLTEFLNEINHYTTIRAVELYKKKKKASFAAILFYPTAKFIKNYFVLRGFLDGIPGILSAMLMSFHSYLVRGKLWSLWHS